MQKIINSGSDGNCEIYFGCIAVDMGVNFKKIAPYLKDLKIILLTHLHGDHLNIETLKKICFERPSIRIACGIHLAEILQGFKNVDYCMAGELYDYGRFQIRPIIAYHDVQNFGWRIFKDGKKVFRVTDTQHLEGIEAKNYDLYAIESNYNEDTVFESITQADNEGRFSHKRGAINSHLSEQQCNEFFFKNKGDHSILSRLHQSKTP